LISISFLHFGQKIPVTVVIFILENFYNIMICWQALGLVTKDKPVIHTCAS
jgi:hypothetical protein